MLLFSINQVLLNKQKFAKMKKPGICRLQVVTIDNLCGTVCFLSRLSEHPEHLEGPQTLRTRPGGIQVSQTSDRVF